MKPHSIFIYGSLMAPQVVEVLLGRIPEQITAARLAHYSRYPVKGQVFPAIIPGKADGGEKSAAGVTGVILFGLSDGERKALDWFEDVEYQRTPVQVSYVTKPTMSDGHPDVDDSGSSSSNENQLKMERLDTEAYVWANPLSELELGKDWSFQTFQEQHLDWYLENVVKPCREEIDQGYHLEEN